MENNQDSSEPKVINMRDWGLKNHQTERAEIHKSILNRKDAGQQADEMEVTSHSVLSLRGAKMQAHVNHATNTTKSF